MSNPNIIICTCDQLRAFELGCYGHSVVRTPHIDGLAGCGTRFETAVTNQPVCMAARSIILSGQYARHCTGGISNVTYQTEPGDCAMPEYPRSGRPHLPDPTLPELLRERGYHCATIGKWHIHSWPHDIGFDEYLIPRVHHCHTGQSYTRNGEPEFIPVGYSVDFEGKEVERFFKERRDGQPFFLYYNISPPHCPLADAPEHYLNMYRPEDVVLRPNVNLDVPLADQDYWFKVYRHDFRYYSFHLPYTEKLPADYTLRHLIAEYYGLTTWVDDMVGRMLASLGTAGLTENTIVVFTSDHGDNLGSHGRVQKGTLNDEAIRIPYIMRIPGLSPGTIVKKQVGSLVDLMPTLLELAGADIPAHVHGHSLTPILRGEADSLAEPGGFIETYKDELGLRTPEHLLGFQKLSADGMMKEEPRYFHDMHADPYQLDNMAGTQRQADICNSLTSRLLNWNSRT